MMRRVLIALFSWNCRLVGWMIVIGLLYAISSNYSGFQVRGQAMRTQFRPESEAATAWLLQRANIKDVLPSAIFPAYSLELQPSLTRSLWSEPYFPQFFTRWDETVQESLTMAFDSRGSLLGAPIVISTPVFNNTYQSHLPASMTVIREDLFLVFQSFAPVRRALALDYLFQIHHLGFPESRLALCVRAPNASYCRIRYAAYDRTLPSDSIVLELHATRQPPLNVAFVWDRATQQFTLPPSDPLNRWRASLDESVLAD